MIGFALSSYFLSELFQQSGIISLLFASITMSHYAWHNLSPQGKHVTSVTFQSIGYGAEVIIFCFVGFSLAPTMKDSANHGVVWKFIFMELFILIISRFMTVLLTYYLFRLCQSKKSKEKNYISLKHLIYLSYAGMVRGAISYSLVARIELDKISSEPLQKHLEMSTYLVIIITTVVFGSFTPLVQSICVPYM